MTEKIFIPGKLYTNGRVIVKCTGLEVHHTYFTATVVAQNEGGLHIGEQNPFWFRKDFIEFTGDPKTHVWKDYEAGEPVNEEDP